MRKILYLASLVVAGTLAVTAPASALTITTYNSLAAFTAAVGAHPVYDFDSDTLGGFDSKDFGDFTLADGAGDVSLFVASGATAGNIDGTPFIQFFDGAGLGEMTVQFAYPISAFALDFVNSDVTGDFTNLIVDGQTFAVGGPLTSGFFGFRISDGTVTDFLLRDNPAGGDVLNFASYDNFHWSRLTPTGVPEPATLLLFGTGLAGLAALRRRRKGEKA